MTRRFAPMIVLAAAAMATPASAADPTGDWQVEGGYATVRIANCDDKLWGIVAWERKPNVDRNNPDPSKRTRPTLGIPILLGMTQEGSNRWDGEIYNTEDGRTYTAHIGLTNPDLLRVEGCVLGFLCGGQSWTRVAAAPPTPTPARPGGHPSRPAPQTSRTTGQAPRPPGQPTASQPAYGTVDDVCAAVAAATGQPVDSRATGAGNGERPFTR